MNKKIVCRNVDPLQFYSQQKKEEADTVVSEILDCDTKLLPDVIPSTVLDNLSSNSTNCDITANLQTIDMGSPTEGECIPEESTVKVVAEMDLSEETENQSVQEDEAQSVEEKRAEHYLLSETSQNSDSSISDQNAHVVDTDNYSNNNAHNSDSHQNIEESSAGNPTTSQLENPLSETDNANDSTESLVHIHLNNSSDFDSFQFWRTPLPQVDLDLDILKENALSSDELQSLEADLRVALSNSMSDLTVCDNQASSALLNENGLANFEAITSGMNNSETTMTVIDGMVQGG